MANWSQPSLGARVRSPGAAVIAFKRGTCLAATTLGNSSSTGEIEVKTPSRGASKAGALGQLGLPGGQSVQIPPSTSATALS
jgi:hypothetical protein